MISSMRIGEIHKRPPGPRKKKCDKLLTGKEHRNTGRRCHRWAMKGQDFCKLHYQNRVGPLNPNWKGGISKRRDIVKFDKVVPESVGRYIAKLAANPELLASKDEIILLEARVSELLSQLSSGATPENWERVDGLVDGVFNALRDEDGELAVNLLKQLKSITAEGNDESDKVWKKINAAIEQRRRIIDTERKVLEQQKLMLTPEKLLVVASETARIVRKFLKEDEYEKFLVEFREVFVPRPDQMGKLIEIEKRRIK